MWLDLQLANLASHTETQSARLLKTALMLPSTRQQLQQQQREGLVLPYYCPGTGDRGLRTGGNSCWLWFIKTRKVFINKTHFFCFFCGELRGQQSSGAGAEAWPGILHVGGMIVRVCVCVCLGFLVITLITRETQQCMMKCFQKYNLPSLSHTLSLSVCLALCCHFSCARHKISKIPAHSRFHVIVVVVVAFFLHLINSTLTNIEIMCTGPTKMSPRAASSLFGLVTRKPTSGLALRLRLHWL